MIEGLGRNATRVVTTHDIEKAMIADRVIVMKKGVIVQCGTPHELVSRNSLFHEMHI